MDNTADNEWLTDVLVLAVIEAAETMQGLSKKKNPHTYYAARSALLTGCRILVEVADGEPVNNLVAAASVAPAREIPHGAAVNRDLGAGPELAALAQALEAGVSPSAELFRTDPRANDPRCVHGLRFAEPCDACELATREPKEPPIAP